ncbi:protein of unknown function DUF1810 [Stanieria cyanosphaera PCC 7437]|uniref:Calpastatin n=1 Tax=Stanieria cyanosphaera (strain ATCC 29371 / PCC 7437) TaxID=111780 RepID=K9XVD4_STAC7|nr:DUF1810 domain-containing protein [Stanieria cyanosphaera]AFZ35617.1 protein of unknown function DUF1810 [Stanieria cyanosphaera PCC 7437]
MSEQDPFDLNRFINTQNQVFDRVLAELKNGRKRSHWMWYTFPQLDGLAQSTTSKYYAIKSPEEAIAYLNHPVLGARILECANTIVAIEGKTVSEIFGYPDDLKLKSSMTLFSEVSAEPIFIRVLDRYFHGDRDDRTLQLLKKLKNTK